MTDRNTSSDEPKILNTTDARQAETGLGAVRILVISTVLVVLGFIAVYLLVIMMNPAQEPVSTQPGPDTVQTEQAPPAVPSTDNTVEAPTTNGTAPIEPAVNEPVQ